MVLVSAIMYSCSCYRTVSIRHQNIRSVNFHSIKQTGAEDGINLSTLTNIVGDAKFLQNSITRYLDEEYIALEVHRKIGVKVRDIYLDCRNRGVVDLGELLMEVGNSLEKQDISDAFVNSWDIANKVADLVMIRMDRELCSCTGDMSSFQTPTLTTSNEVTLTMVDSLKLLKKGIELQSEFARYKLLRNFLEGEIQWQDMKLIVALTLGFRPEPGKIVSQVQALAPVGWNNLVGVPDFSNVNDILVIEKLLSDLPDDEKSTDIVIETLIGFEMYKIMKTNKNDQVGQQRILVAKWLYVQGFLSSEFPARERYIPGHMLDRDD